MQVDKSMIETLANIATIVGFAVSIPLFWKQLRDNNKSINTLAETIKIQQLFLVKQITKISDLTISNTYNIFDKYTQKRYSRGGKAYDKRK